MMKRWLAPLVAALCILGALGVLSPSEASAQRRASLEEGPIVRRQLLYRSSRFELQPRIGATLNDSFKRNIMAGLDLNYYLTNKFGLGVGGYFGAVKLNTDLLDQIEGTVGTDGLAFTTTTALFAAHISYVPIFGKLALFGNIIADYDLHLLAGFGGGLLGAEGAIDDEKLSGFKPGAMLGVGFRLFVADSVAVTVDFRDYLFSSADIQEGALDPTTELRNNFAVGLGVSFFFPGEVPISR